MGLLARAAAFRGCVALLEHYSTCSLASSLSLQAQHPSIMKLFWFVALFLLVACMSNAEDATAPATPTTIEELKKMPIKQLRQFLFARGLECRGCAEKEDFVKLAFENIDTPLKAATPPAPQEEPEKTKEQKDKELADIMASLKSSGLGDGIKMYTKDDFAGLSPEQMADKFGEGRSGKGRGGGGRSKSSRSSKGGKGSSSGSEDKKKTSSRPTSKPAKKIAEEEGDQIEL